MKKGVLYGKSLLMMEMFFWIDFYFRMGDKDYTIVWQLVLKCSIREQKLYPIHSGIYVHRLMRYVTQIKL